MTLHTFENKEFGLIASVNEHAKGFSVVLQDVDSGEYIPLVMIYSTVAPAIAYAKKAVA